MKEDEYVLSETARKLLKAAYKAGGNINKLDFDQGGPLVRAGSFELPIGLESRLALEELVEKGLARHEDKTLYVLTRKGVELAQTLPDD